MVALLDYRLSFADQREDTWRGGGRTRGLGSGCFGLDMPLDLDFVRVRPIDLCFEVIECQVEV